MPPTDDSDALLAEQIAYYRAAASEYAVDAAAARQLAAARSLQNLPLRRRKRR